MIDSSPALCPICNHIRLTAGRVCRVCMGFEDEYGNPISELVSDARDTVSGGISFEHNYKPELKLDRPSKSAPVITTPAPKRSHKKQPRLTGAVSKQNHIQVKICPFCRAPLAPWQAVTCGKTECEQKAVRIARMPGEKKHCRRCT